MGKNRRPIEGKFKRRKRRRFNKKLTHRPFVTNEMRTQKAEFDALAEDERVRREIKKVRAGRHIDDILQTRSKLHKMMVPLKKLSHKAAKPV